MSLIKKIKQFINGSWKEFNLSSDTLDNVVILDGNQNITGVKTFGNVVTIGKNTSFTANSILPPIETSLIDSTGIYVANTTQHTDITGNLIRIGSGVHPCGRIYLQAGSSIPGVPNLSISTDSDAYSSSAKFIGTTWGTAENVQQTTTTLLMPSDGTTGTIATQEWVQENISNGASDLNLENGEGIDSIVLRYSGEVDATHFGNKDYVLDDNGNPVKDETGSILYGESAAIFGEANENNANRALLAGKLNKNSGANAIVGGLRNTVKAHHGITIGSVNTVEKSAIRSVSAGYNNINSGEDSIQTGTSNKNYGIGSAEFGSQNINHGNYSALIGSQNINRGNYSALIGVVLRNEQQNEDGTYNTKVIVGKWNEDKLENIFEVGNGTSNAEPSNAFEVLRDGRAKVKTAPKEEDDVVRKKELDLSWNSFNIENGEGTDSLVQKYTGAEDSTHFGNKDYLLDEEGNPVKDKNGEILYGESAAIFGEANSNNANRALLAGKLNNNSGANAIVGGLRNTVKAHHGITIGSVNTVEASAIRSVTAGYNNINSGEDSIQTGTSNNNYGIGSAEFGSQNINHGHYSALIGSGLRNEQQNENGTYNTKVIVGKWNLDRLGNIFEVGNGENDKKRSNAFEVLYDGRAKVKTAPKEEDDVVRKLELDGKISISDINQAFFNSLYN